MKNVEDVYPLSPLQESLLFSVLSAPGSTIGFEQSSWMIEAPIDASAFRRTWERTLERHPILRTAFFVDAGKKPLQVVRQKVELPFDLLDWRHLEPEEQQRRLDEYLENDRRRGFDPARAPLLRVGLIRLAEARYVLVWSNQHLLLDGWCAPLILREVLEVYGRFVAGRQDDLPRPRPFREYIAWLQKQHLEEAERYWRSTLAGFTRPTALRIGSSGGDREPGARTYPNHEIRLPAGEAEGLRRFCREHELTLNTFVQSAWAVLLARYSGTDDVVFGSVVSGRPADLPGAEAMIGMFINNLPVRVRVERRARLLPWLQSVQASLAEMRRWEHTPLSQVQEWSEMPWGRRLFETLVVFQNYASGESPDASLASLGIGPQRYRFETSYPLALEVAPRSGLGLRLYYDAEAFPALAAQRLLAHFATILHGMAAAPSAAVEEIPWLTPPELHAVLREWAGEPGAVAGFPGSSVALLGPDLQPVPAGLTAELWVAGEAGWVSSGWRARFQESGKVELRGSVDSPA
ncbi:MAG TPA: condensation domain-containing protein, partial [Thermoanaerobaculia bacterium]|nr:condensation domain-containing protein [Thermoanaerobaculia bacterium]